MGRKTLLEKNEERMDRSLGRIVTEGIAEISNELTAANKAIVALSEALEYVEADMNDYMPIPSDTISRVTQALTTHADAIKRARTNALDPRADKG